MAITLDATVGGANANTYITLDAANSFIEGLVLSDDAAAWDGSRTIIKIVLCSRLHNASIEKSFWGLG